MAYLFLAFAAIVGYFLGSINFARIFQWHLNKKDITQVGSHNPGTMNVLRTRGFGEAMLTLAFEALKVGGPALACWFAFSSNPDYEQFAELSYFISAFFGILGHCFPIYYGFKGGKGVACTFGMFLFNPHFWWISLVGFAICFLLFIFIQYVFIISFFFIFVMAIYGTVFYAALLANPANIAVIAILWVNALLVVFLHRGNIKRFFAGTENKVNFREKVFGKLKKKGSAEAGAEEKTEDGTGNGAGKSAAEEEASGNTTVEQVSAEASEHTETGAGERPTEDEAFQGENGKTETREENKNSKNAQKRGKNVKK